MGNRRGFTLIELIFVLVLLALITSVAIPQVSSSLGLTLRPQVLRVAGFLETAYQRAVLSHQKIKINFDLDTGQYWAENIVPYSTIPLVSESTNLDEILNEFRKRSEEQDEEEQKKIEEAQFQKIEDQGLRPTKIDSRLKFRSVMFPAKEITKTEGVVSFYISASGVNDEMVVQLGFGDDITFSIIFPPVTGKPRIQKGEYEAN